MPSWERAPLQRIPASLVLTGSEECLREMGREWKSQKIACNLIVFVIISDTDVELHVSDHRIFPVTCDQWQCMWSVVVDTFSND